MCFDSGFSMVIQFVCLMMQSSGDAPMSLRNDGVTPLGVPRLLNNTTEDAFSQAIKRSRLDGS